jgi:hypothetical protein
MSHRGPALNRRGGDFGKFASIDADKETTMKTFHLTGLALALAAGIALPLAGSAEAAMGGALPTTEILPVENAQFFFLGHNFCWYDDGWQGPGWYWCGYAWNNGYGWGGAEGWNGWNRGAPRAYNGPRGGTPRVHVGAAPQYHTGRTPQFHTGGTPQHTGPTFNKAPHGHPGGQVILPKGK